MIQSQDINRFERSKLPQSQKTQKLTEIQHEIIETLSQNMYSSFCQCSTRKLFNIKGSQMDAYSLTNQKASSKHQLKTKKL